MDMLKGLAEKAKQASSGGNNNNAATTGTQGTSNQAASGQEDYVDKGMSCLSTNQTQHQHHNPPDPIQLEN